jgi:hypothetical protein
MIIVHRSRTDFGDWRFAGKSSRPRIGSPGIHYLWIGVLIADWTSGQARPKNEPARIEIVEIRSNDGKQPTVSLVGSRPVAMGHKLGNPSFHQVADFQGLPLARRAR